MENKKSVVRSAIFKREWQGKGIYEIQMDNGDKGEYFSQTKDQSVFVEGKEIEYTIEKKEKGGYTNFYINPKKSSNGFAAKTVNPVYANRQTALKCSVDLVCAGKITVDDISKYCTSFMKFLTGE
jgi:hypothetical protein